jgi:LysR family hydrogen peroxide-inducible transcriptional activator
MNLSELRYIVALARERHFGRAAESCHVSQPTLSVAVKKLESELGVSLFERRKTDITPTAAGEQIIEQAHLVLEGVDRIKQMAQHQQDQLSAPLRLGAIYTIGPYLFPHLIPVLHKAAPEMPLIIEENYTAELSRLLKQGELDAIIVSLPFEEPGIVTLPLYEEPFIVLLPASHPWRDRDVIPIKELADENLLLLGPGHCFRNQVLQLCPECRFGPGTNNTMAADLEGSSLETIRHMVASGLGVTVLPCSAASADRYAQRLMVVKRIAEPVPKRTVALAWRLSFPRPKAIEALRKAMGKSRLSCTHTL